MISQRDIDYQERRGNFHATSLQNVVKGQEVSGSTGFWRDFAGLVIGITTIVALFAALVACGL